MKRIIQLAGLLFIVVFLTGGCKVLDSLKVTNEYSFPVTVQRHAVYIETGETKVKDHMESFRVAAGSSKDSPIWWAGSSGTGLHQITIVDQRGKLLRRLSKDDSHIRAVGGGCGAAVWNITVGPSDDTEILMREAALARQKLFTPNVSDKAILYQRLGNTLGLFALVWHLFGLWLLLASGLAQRLRDRVESFGPRWTSISGNAPPFRALALYFAVYLLLTRFWSLPFGLLSYGLELHFGFSHQTIGGFLLDDLRGSIIGLSVVPLIWGIYWLYCRSPHRWWLWMWAASVPVILGSIIIQPLIIAPLYNKFMPLPPGKLHDKIAALAAKADITDARILVQDTSRRTAHVNAYVTGIGPTTRIVIEDTALTTLPEDQILAMVGHEMGHYVEGHIWYGALSSAIGAGLFLFAGSRLLPRLLRRGEAKYGVWGATDLAALPLFLLAIALFMQLQMPIANAESRYIEHRADIYGLRLTGLNEAMAHLFVGFAERDYADPSPPPLLHFWYGSHPTLQERIDFALNYKP